MEKKEFREILIFVAGTTPQIITETIYALLHQKPPVIPSDIYVITTSHGKKLVQKNLMDSGIFAGFCREFKIPPALLQSVSIITVKDGNGRELEDIRDKKDNENLGNFIAGFIKEKATDEKARLHCSLAGGRKTMSFYLGSALQLFGRPWDKLYHVLVAPDFESNPDFYYKPKKNRLLKKNDLALNTRDAKIFLAELPFIRLTDKVPLGGKSFKELVEEGQKEIDTALTQPFIRIKLKDGIVSIGNRSIEFKPFHIVFYSYLLRHKLERCPYPEKAYCLDCTDCYLQINDLVLPGVAEIMAKDYEAIYGKHSGHVENFRRQWKDGIDAGKLRSDRSKINREITETLEDETLATYYTVTSLRKYGATRFGVRAEKGKIGIE